jgi:hypothetical protein
LRKEDNRCIVSTHKRIENRANSVRVGGGKVPRYFFTIRRPGWVKDDPQGTNLPDVAAALSYAERKIVELRKESPYNDPALVMTVKDEARKTVLSLPFFPGS